MKFVVNGKEEKEKRIKEEESLRKGMERKCRKRREQVGSR